MKFGEWISISILTVFLAGCSTLDSTSSAEATALAQDLESCRESSLKQVPAKMVVITPALTLPDRMHCSSGTERGSTYCVPVPGMKYAAVEEDLNLEARAQVFSACLMVKRYSEQALLAQSSNKLGNSPDLAHALPSAQLDGSSFEVLTQAGGVNTAAARSGLMEPQRARAWQGVKDCDFCPRMVLVPEGSFKMGSPLTSAEQPVHSVKLSSFLLGKYEVTQAEWLAVMGSNPSANKSCGSYCPVDRVSWSSAQEFLRRLNERTGLNFRLPSEAEWEYAARAGRSKLPSEEELQTLKSFAWYNGNSGGELHPVGQKIPNAFGLHDMQGNVWEWVADVMHENYQGASPTGRARQLGSAQGMHVLRGGSYFDNPKFLRTTHRNADTPDAAYVFFGFRVARDLAAPGLRAEQSGGNGDEARKQ